MIMEISEDTLVWSVLAAPRIVPRDWDLFWTQWRAHSGESHIVKNDPAGNQDSNYEKTGKRTNFFMGINIYAKNPKALDEGHWKLPYLPYTEIFPNLLDDIHAACPWVSDVLYARLWQSTMPIPMHRDHSKEDVALRAMIYDENTTPTFKVLKPRAGTHYVKLPENESNWFVYNNAKCLHGSDKTQGVNKIILLIVHECNDKQKMIDHLKISAEKYPELCVYR